MSNLNKDELNQIYLDNINTNKPPVLKSNISNEYIAREVNDENIDTQNVGEYNEQIISNPLSSMGTFNLIPTKEQEYQENHVQNSSSPQNPLDNVQQFDKLQELLESKRIMSTLRSIKTSNSINYEDIKLLPSLFVDMQEALKKSNANVLELKETIKEKMKNERRLKEKIRDLESENNKLVENLYKYKGKTSELKQKYDKMKLDNINLNKNLEYANDFQSKYEQLSVDNNKLRLQINDYCNKIDGYELKLSSLSKEKSDLEQKNKKYKSANGLLQNEIKNIEENIKEVKSFQEQIKNMQNGMRKMREVIADLEEKKGKLEKENLELMGVVKKMKGELKSNLTEKISILEKLDKEKLKQKSIDDSTASLIEKLKSENSRLQNELIFFEDFKLKYSELFEDFNNLVAENVELREQLQDKKFTNQDLSRLQEQHETEIFNLKSELNVWKSNFVEIGKFKLVNFDTVRHQNVENCLKIDQNYILNAPKEIKEISSKLVTYFKLLIEKENYSTINLKKLKEALTYEQDMNDNLAEKLENEKILRRKIHNRYMYLRGNLRVMCRIRPFLEGEVVNKKSQLETIKTTNDIITINESNKKPKCFEFDYIFDKTASQKDVYEEANLLIQSMLQGNNICVIAYGQTCTGKTYTIQGPDGGEPGIAVRSAQEIFNMLKGEQYQEARLTMTIIEIYNEQIFNILDSNTPALSMYENSNGNLIIPDLVPVNINSFDEAEKLFKLAAKFRHTASTDYNNRSSRSHCIITFGLKLTDSSNKITRSTLHILDLAGSERISKSQTRDEKIKKEAICINLSLHALSTVLNSIAIKAAHVPYRDSKLTHFLKESLKDEYNILLILHLSPNVRDLAETISTLQFGERIIKICHHKTGREKVRLVNAGGKKN